MLGHLRHNLCNCSNRIPFDMLFGMVLIRPDVSKHLQSMFVVRVAAAYKQLVAGVQHRLQSRSHLSPFIDKDGVPAKVFAQSDILVIHLRKQGSGDMDDVACCYRIALHVETYLHHKRCAFTLRLACSNAAYLSCRGCMTLDTL